MSDADLAALRFATQTTSQTLITALIAAGKYNCAQLTRQRMVRARARAILSPNPSPRRASVWLARHLRARAGPRSPRHLAVLVRELYDDHV
jgi:hypothetical protein